MFDIKRFGKVLAVTCAVAASTVGIVGCAPAKPDNAQALVAKVREAGVVDNAHIDGDMDIKFGLGAFSMDMPMVVSGDFSGKSSHIHMTSDTLGISSEAYTVAEGDKVVQYSKSEGSLMGLSSSEPSWMKSDSNFGVKDSVDDALSDEVVSKAEFAANSDGTYTLTFGKDAVSILSDKLSKAAGSDSQTDVSSSVPLDSNSLSNVSDASVKVTVSEDFKIVSVAGSMKSSYDISEESKGDMTLDFEFNFSKHGQVSEADVKVPDDVVKSAIDPNALGSSLWSDDGAVTSDGGQTTLGDGSSAGSNAALVDDVVANDTTAK